jgi:subtilisin family serine protease
MYHAKEYNIRVMNLSIATDSTESWRTDPLCVAVRSAAAAGITVVVAAGNFGFDASGGEVYGRIGSPGTDPSVITVGAVNLRNTAARQDDSVNGFSSRGPTRGVFTDSAGVRRIDNLLKPDLVAPGNKLIGAASTAAYPLPPTWNTIAASHYGDLVGALGIVQRTNESQMMLSGTSIAAPAVSGAVALLLQANPGLTPPLVKAILQYSAQPLPGANLLQQGAGLLNIDGAVRARAAATRSEPEGLEARLARKPRAPISPIRRISAMSWSIARRDSLFRCRQSSTGTSITTPPSAKSCRAAATMCSIRLLATAIWR